MTRNSRGIFLATLSLGVLALAACSSTGGNVSNRTDASRVDSILQRAARDAKASGNKAETAVLLEQIYNNKPEDAAVATAYAQALREDEQLNRARQVLAPFTEGKDAYPDAVTELAMVQLALGQYKESELTARRGIELDPNNGRGYMALGTALDAQNYHEQAEVAFRRGLEKWKGDPAPMMNNLALNLASQNKLDQAIDMLQKAKEISPGRQELERNLRIVTTLKEGADDFLIKQENEKKGIVEKKPAPAAKPAEITVKKEEAPKQASKKTEEVDQDGVDNKQLKPAAKKAAPEKVEPAATNTNRRGSTQNFGTAN